MCIVIVSPECGLHAAAAGHVCLRSRDCAPMGQCYNNECMTQWLKRRLSDCRSRISVSSFSLRYVSKEESASRSGKAFFSPNDSQKPISHLDDKTVIKTLQTFEFTGKFYYRRKRKRRKKFVDSVQGQAKTEFSKGTEDQQVWPSIEWYSRFHVNAQSTIQLNID